MQLYKLTAGSMAGSAEFIVVADSPQEAKQMVSDCITRNYVDDYDSPMYSINSGILVIARGCSGCAAKVVMHKDTTIYH